MYRFVSLFILFAWQVNCAFAQQKVFSVKSEFKSLENMQGFKEQAYFVIKGETAPGNYLIGVINTLNGTVKSFACNGNNLQLLGCALNNDTLDLYLSTTYAGSGEKMQLLSFAVASGNFTTIKETIKYDTHQISNLSAGNIFSTLSLQKGKLKILLENYQQAVATSPKTFEVTDAEVYKHLKKHNFVFIPDYPDITLELARMQEKLYGRGNKIMLISDSWKGKKQAELLLVELDTSNQTLTPRKLPLPYLADVAHNSFLWKDYLFVLGIDKTMLSVDIFDAVTLYKVKSYRHLKGEPITIKKSDLFKNGENLNKQWLGKWEGSEVDKLTLKELSEGTPVITVSSATDEQHIQLLIGSYEASKFNSRGSPGMMTPVGGGSISTPHGSVSLPTSYRWTSGGYSSKTAASNVSFYGYLHKEALTIPAKLPFGRNIFTRVDNRVKQLNFGDNSGSQCVISSADKTYLIHINKKTQMLTIEAF